MQKSLQNNKKQQKGFTLVELLVVIAVIALLMAILLPALTKAREQGKRAVCLTHIKQLQLAWNMYCDANNEKVPVGDVWYSWGFPSTYLGGPQLAWHEWPHPYPHTMPPNTATNHDAAYPINCVELGTCPEDTWQHAIAEGTMWKYVRDYRIYQCPVGEKGEYVTYAMSHSMHTYPGSAGPGSVPRTIILRNQIKRTTERMVFLDAGEAKQGAFFLNYNGTGGAAPPGSFGDHRPKRHGNGTTFSFADGHAEYRRWANGKGEGVGNGNLTETGGWGGESNPCFCDWRWFCKVTWGDVPLSCTGGDKCDD